jgi:RNA polymerase primary sigma factor
MTDEENEVLDIQEKALQFLTDKERRVIELRFGLINREFLTYDKIAKECGVSKHRVYQVLQRSFKKIRHHMSLNKVLTDTNLPNNNNQTTT